MERLSISEFSTYRWPFELELINYPLHGFQNIGIWNQKLEDMGESDGADWLFDSQMGVSSYSWVGGFTGSEGVSHKDAINNAISSIRTASRIGAKTVLLYPGAKNGHTNRHALRLLTTALQALIPVAEDYGVRLALEPMDSECSKRWSIFSDSKETIEFANNFDPSELGLVLDLYHVGLEEQLYCNVKNMIERIALVQLADRKLTDCCVADEQRRKPLGKGNVLIDLWIRELELAGYEGFYEIELFGPEFEYSNYPSQINRAYDWIEANLAAFETRSTQAN